jgi:hemerythrin
MSLLKWNSHFSVGVESIDDEHREMIHLINGIYEKLESAPDADQVEQCLGDIFTTISMHFALEERMMRNCAYSKYDDHKEDHEDLLDQIRDLMDDFVADPKTGATLLEQRLSDWFSTHFSTHDAGLHGSLKN